jgi:predicted permease
MTAEESWGHFFYTLATANGTTGNSTAVSSQNTAAQTAQKISETGLAVLCLIAAGFILSLVGTFPTDKALPYINKFLFYLAVPALIFRGLATQDFLNDNTFQWDFVLANLVIKLISKLEFSPIFWGFLLDLIFGISWSFVFCFCWS